jgi:hypothetical protein
MFGIGGGAKDPVVSRGNSRLPHQVLGEDLGSLNLGSVFPGTENAQALALKNVNDPLGERLLRTHDGQSDTLAARELNQASLIASFDRDVLCVQCRAGIPRRTKNPSDAGRLREFPAQGVLAPSLADHQDFQTFISA